MSNDYKNKGFKELLDKLQQESWQLELIISGFAIFGLFTAFPKIGTAINIAKFEEFKYYVPLLFIALIACAILIFNLLIHVILRGLWIGALGLRYVSGDIDFESLNYNNKFTKYLKRKIVSFDKYVATLENYCSVLFAVSFLLIFYVLSIGAVVVSIVLIATYIISNDSLHEGFRIALGVFLLVTIGIGSILTFIDFFTQGFLKKKNWLAKIYFPFYRVISYITLSFLYRPLVYNFLDNKFTKRLSLVLVPAYLVILVIISFKYKNSNYVDVIKNNSTLYIDNREYNDKLIKEDELVKRGSIQSKVITAPYINFFRVFNESIENRIFKSNSSLKPKNDDRGYKTDIVIINSSNSVSLKKRDSLAKEYVKTFNSIHRIYIDTLEYKTEFLLSKNNKNQTGFETFIPTKNLPEGKHILRFKRQIIRKKDTFFSTELTIPFWYFKNN